MDQPTERRERGSRDAPAPWRPDTGALDGPGFRAFYERHLHAVLRFLRFEVRDEERGDVASQTFEIAARDLERFEVPPGKDREKAERNWLLTIARNVARSSRRRTRLAEQIELEAIEAPNDPERDTAAFDLAVLLLWTLPERTRVLYLMHHLNGLTHQEIAEQLSLPLGTVKTQLRHAQGELDAAITRLAARERLERRDYLRAVPLPFATAAGLIEALRGAVEEVDPAIAASLWREIHGGSGPARTPPAVQASPPRAPSGPDLGATGTAGVAGAALKAATSTTLVKGGVIAAAFVVGGAAELAVLRWPAPPAPVAVTPIDGSAFAVVPGATPGNSAVVSAPVTPSAPVPAFLAPLAFSSSAVVARPSAAESFRTETDVMQAARGAFGSGDFRRAFVLTEQHARRYPGGTFVAEREAIAIRALVQIGRLGDARARARSFRRAFPRSIFRGAVDAAVGESEP